MEKKRRNPMSWAPHLEWVITLLTIFGGLYMVQANLDSKITCINSRIDQVLMAWHEETKDFHGRLCAIEERNKGK